MNRRLRSFAGSILRLPVVGRSRRAAGLFVAPVYHGHISSLHERVADLDRRLAPVEPLASHMPAVLNAISSVNGSTRLLRRELEAVRSDLASERTERAELATALYAHVSRLDGHVRDELWPLRSEVEGLVADRETLAWLVKRVETVRAEVMYEMRYRTAPGDAPPVERRVVNDGALADEQGDGLRVNLGCGLLPMDGYVNVDMRELPGVDVVAGIDDLPFDPDSLAEIYSAHTLEHFPQEQLQRTLLPYWRSLLKPGGQFRAVVPDIAAMIEQYQRGEIPFEQFRTVAYGGQEYEGDFHHTAFTPESLGELLGQAGFTDVDVIERGRPNGDCLEFEIVARRAG
jgi:hypothetical protein